MFHRNHHTPSQPTLTLIPAPSINTMSISSYQVVEPHPHATTPYVHTARGGAGNVANTSAITDGSNATGPASRHPSLRNARRSVYISGRGGAGNLHRDSEQAIFSFDEELKMQMQQTENLAPVCYIGRGGAGNRIYAGPPIQTSQSSDAESVESSSSSDSGCESGGDALNRMLKKGWEKVIARL